MASNLPRAIGANQVKGRYYCKYVQDSLLLYVQDKLMDTKLTLKLDQAVIARAKRFAKAHHTSVSKMVERYLDQVTKQEEREDEELTPLVRSLYGIAFLPENADVKQDYYEHLLKKHSPEHAD